MTKDRQVLVVGAGLGGLTAALALHQRGIRVTLAEQSRALGEVGAGITVGPNATQILFSLGLKEQLEPWGAVPESVGVNHVDSGLVLSRTERGEADYRSNFGAPLWHMHRADMHGVMTAAAQDAGIPILLNKRLIDLERNATGVTAIFSDDTRMRTDLLVGADGLKSAVRRIAIGADTPEFTGFVAWRALIPRPNPTRLEPDFLAYAAPQKLFARYPVHKRTLLNYVAMAKSDDWSEEDWMLRSTPESALAAYDGCCEEIREIISATPEGGCYKWALHVRKPINNWVTDNVTLLGDAAHPMTPFLGMGAGMALEDAMILARCLESFEDWDEALQRYQAIRIPRAHRMFEESAARGRLLTGEDSSKLKAPEDLEFAFQYNATSVALD